MKKRFYCWLFLGVILMALPIKANSLTFDFAETTLPAEWTVYDPYPGHNYYTLEENPGYLRYRLTPATRGYFAKEELNWEYPGMLLSFNLDSFGTDWELKAKLAFHFPYSNGRQIITGVGFGDPELNGLFLRRHRDLAIGEISISTIDDYRQGGPNRWWQDLNGITDDAYYIKITRTGNKVAMLLSSDGITYQQYFPDYYLDPDVAILTQNFYIHGGNWFAPTDSYVDFDWITVNSTVVPLPGSVLILGSGIIRLWINRKKILI